MVKNGFLVAEKYFNGRQVIPAEWVDAQVYFKVKPDEESVKRSQYNVNNYQYQIVNLEGLGAGFSLLLLV
jgi:hypothetical protein